MLARFFYKSIISVGYIQLIIILVNFLISKNLLFLLIKKKYLFFIIILNLVIFLYIPAELSYLQPALVFLYFFVSNYFTKKIVYLIIILNFLSWIINFDFIEIKYKSDNKCDPIQAINADIKFSIKKGAVEKFIIDRNLIECWAYNTHPSRTEKILQGEALK